MVKRHQVTQGFAGRLLAVAGIAVLVVLTSCSPDHALPLPNSGLPTTTATATHSPTSGNPQADMPLEPVLMGPRILPYSWSPDGYMLAFWTWTPEEVTVDYTYPSGTLHFYDSIRNRICEAPVRVAYPYFTSTFVWDADGVAWVLNAEGEIAAVTPCAVSPTHVPTAQPEKIISIAATPSGRLLVEDISGQVVRSAHVGGPGKLLLTGQFTDFLYDVHEDKVMPLEGRVVYGVYSPNATRLAFSTGQEDAPDQIQTQIVNLETAEVENTFSWSFQPAKGMLSEPTWLSEEALLTTATAVGGPRLAHVSGEVIDVAEMYFDDACQNELCEVRAARFGASGAYHILLEPAAQGKWFLYHSENGSVENVPPVAEPTFSPDGRWLSGKVSGGAAHGLWLRPVEGGAPPTEIPLPSLINVPLAWSPDSAYIAYALEAGIGLTRIGTKGVANVWSTGRYSPIAIVWSTDTSRLAVQATAPDASGNPVEALFIIVIP